MSNKNKTKKPKHGGSRPNSGAKGREGGTEKFSVSVTKEVLHAAMSKWHDTRSQLVDRLLREFVERPAI